ncbi:hypothetical protein LTR10_017228 [Elasticomyces elasticus]|uniref:Phosphoglycerate mutase family protein n=1 Tax=Exophiala sideris TaxID=1016849 RepID=A0ABR0J5A5_9EURO|nr:hypothetical protein LTR10_017228 [Elasticomyces elasticus]KAK5028416.1 hypothetical protein LTS07_006507 [Exophiala sideris]KAK5035941.1 hypothetical protein LTR13_005511 [Exophiala sideris]KAK5056977.1 hypothetical protein LTR69_007615 [Exophiala sideris]KAK5181384.1 hypothetical protein LTR44_006179 [Eurotiomycetes sp. CCFEE 6388]
MGRQPAVIIITRHGARLDQADRKWAENADKPYDTPLSYGGWVQSQNLGVRINNELHNLDVQSRTGEENKDDANQDAPPRKKRKIIIHSSPYLRCVQTAVAISAGIQHPQNHSRSRPQPRQRSSLASLRLSPTEEAPDVLPQSKNVDEAPFHRNHSHERPQTNRLGYNTCLLRIDAFLGEWQSPTYFDSLPPPPSAVMVSEAKMGLQLPQEEIKGADLSGTLSYELPSTDWDEKENELSSVPVHEKTGLRAMAAAGHSFSKRPRNVSFGTELANGARLLNRNLQRQPVGYSPPIPTYAMGPSDKIPPGYVAHARDVCLEVDREWDSETSGLDWGDGGPFDEEWGNMHRRFRNGLQKLLEFYERQGELEGHKGAEEEEEDLVILMVTHQAGCNALIRILTGAPALHDVATSSLTLAVKSENPPEEQSPITPTRRRGSLDLSICNAFDVKIIASTEHLRAGSNPLGLNSPRLGKNPAFANPRTVGADSPEGFSLGATLGHRKSNSLVMPRSQSLQRQYPADADSVTEPASGLWRRGSRYSRDETADSSDAGTDTPSTQSGNATDSIPEETWRADKVPVRSASQRGLWGGESIKRERSPGKRRWTAVERSP